MTESHRAAGAAILRRTADWLDANRQKHIRATLATDANFAVCSPLDDEADCFCAVGRLVREAGLEKQVESITINDTEHDRMEACYTAADEWLDSIGAGERALNTIYAINDCRKSGVADHLRELAATVQCS